MARRSPSTDASLARKIFYGERGQLRQRYREGQEDQLGALGLVLNAITIWNTRYMHVALDQLHAHDEAQPAEHLQRLSALGHRHINELGRYNFPDSTPQHPHQLRPLRPIHPAAAAETLIALATRRTRSRSGVTRPSAADAAIPLTKPISRP